MRHLVSRRQFIRGDFGGRTEPVRPPGALTEHRFLTACSQCAACIDACPERIISRGSGGYPEINFQLGGCTFCGECIRVCRDGALKHSEDNIVGWPIIATINSTCLSHQGITCRICADACDVDAIQFDLKAGGTALPRIDTSSCTGCGACVGDCPVHAIEMNKQFNQPEDNPCQSSISAVC